MLNWLTLARHFAAQCNVNLRIGGTNCPCTDGKTVFLPALPAVLKEEDRNKLIFWIVHETSHILYSSFDILFKNPTQFPDDVFKNALNSAEDARIDILRHLLNKPMARWRRLYFKCEKSGNPEDFDLTWMILISIYLESAFIDDRILEAGEQLQVIKNEVAKREPGLEIKLDSALLAVRCDMVSMVSNEKSSSEDAIGVTIKYLEALDYFEQKSEDQDEKSESKDDAESDPEDSEDQNHDDDSPSDESDEEDGQGTSSDQEDTDSQQEAGDQDANGDGSEELDPCAEGDDTNAQPIHASGVDLEELIEKINQDPDYQELPKIDNDYLDLQEKVCPEDLMHLNNSLSSVSGSVKRLQNQLEDLLEDLANVDTSYEDAGRIKGKSISRVCCGKTNVFQKKADVELPVKYLTLIVDVSYSMQDEYLPAMQACGMLMKALGGIDVDYSVIAFGDGIYSIKRVNEPTQKGLARLGGSESVIDGSTPMAEALAIAIDECPSEMGKHDVIIITDGSPDCTQSVVETANYYNVHGVTTNLLSVGIDPTWASNSLISAYHIKTISELPAALLRMSESIFTP